MKNPRVDLSYRFYERYPRVSSKKRFEKLLEVIPRDLYEYFFNEILWYHIVCACMYPSFPVFPCVTACTASA